ncbi:hypothetical protein V6B16_14925 [Salinimicrobium catena]|uniref:hypothetical protein n=1 Tax=Salinimicrobium catena TaxID=390640 RepID=UPI002FE43E51
MNEELLQEFLSIGNNTQEDAESIFRLTTHYLNELKAEEYDPEHATLLEGLVNKMVTICSNLSFDENNLSADLEKNVQTLMAQIGAANKNKNAIILYYNKVFSDTMKFYNLILKHKPKETINIGPFKPNNSDKTKIAFKITEAIELINNSTILKDKIKKKLTSRLTQVITELNNPKTNWNTYFNSVSQTIVLLGALGSIASGSEAAKSLLDSKSKLEEANEEVQKSSITISERDLKEVFVFDETKELNTSHILQLEDGSSKKKKRNK